MFLLDARLWSDSVHEVTLAVCPSVRPSFRPSVRPSLSFLKIGSLVLSDIVHDDIWPLYYLVTDEARFLKKKIFFATQIWAQAQNEIFRHFLEFGSGSLVFLEIGYNDSLQQWLTSTRGLTNEKKFWAQIWPRRAKIGSKIRFFTILSSLVH